MGPWLVGVAFVDQRWGIGQLLPAGGVPLPATLVSSP